MTASKLPQGATVRLGGPTIAHFGRLVTIVAVGANRVTVRDGNTTYVVDVRHVDAMVNSEIPNNERSK